MLQLNHGRFGLLSHITSLQSLTGISAPEPVALNIDFLLTQWRYEDEVAPSERARVLKGLEDTGTKFWNVFALQVRTQLLCRRGFGGHRSTQSHCHSPYVSIAL